MAPSPTTSVYASLCERMHWSTCWFLSPALASNVFATQTRCIKSMIEHAAKSRMNTTSHMQCLTWSIAVAVILVVRNQRALCKTHVTHHPCQSVLITACRDSHLQRHLYHLDAILMDLGGCGFSPQNPNSHPLQLSAAQRFLLAFFDRREHPKTRSVSCVSTWALCFVSVAFHTWNCK